MSNKYNPNDTSCEEEKYIIKTFSGKTLLNYSHETHNKIQITNNLYQSIRNTPLIVLSYSVGTSGNDYVSYNSATITNQANTYYADQLVLDNPPIISDKNIMMMDCELSADAPTTQPLVKKFPFITNSNIMVDFKFFFNLKILSEAPYGDNIVNRWSTILYYPTTLVYLLISKNPYKIYVLQLFKSNLENPVSSPEQLVAMNEYLELPEGWTYAYMQLPKDKMLEVQSLGQIRVLNDNLGNSYVFIDPSTNTWLYDKYRS